MAEVPPPLTELFWESTNIYQEEGFWYYSAYKETVAAFRTQFHARQNDDVLLTSFPKSGATWLISLSLSVLHRDAAAGDDILTNKAPHELVPTLDFHFLKPQLQQTLLNPPPAGHTRLLHSHLPYRHLPETVIGKKKKAEEKEARLGCKIVHVARNPKDVVVSMWRFYNKAFRTGAGNDVTLEVAVESFCRGVSPFAPYYEHVLEYWEESRRRPEEVLFLKYEDLCKEPNEQMEKLASFLGKPFGDVAEVEEVVRRSSFDRMKELEVNKNGFGEITQTENINYFRKGGVGDWKNHLTPEMAQRIDELTRVKLQGTGLFFDDE